MANNRLYRKVSQPYFARKAEGAGDNDTSEYLKEQEDGTVVLGKKAGNKVFLTEKDGIKFQAYDSNLETPHELKIIPINDKETFFGNVNSYESSTKYNGIVFRNDTQTNFGLVSADENYNLYTTPGSIAYTSGEKTALFGIGSTGFEFYGFNLAGNLSGEMITSSNIYSVVYNLGVVDSDIRFNMHLTSENKPDFVGITFGNISLVEANPRTTSSSETLTSIGISGINYKLPSGGSSSGIESFTFPINITWNTNNQIKTATYTFDSVDSFNSFRTKLMNSEIIAYIVTAYNNNLVTGKTILNSWSDLVYTGIHEMHLYFIGKFDSSLNGFYQYDLTIKHN